MQFENVTDWILPSDITPVNDTTETEFSAFSRFSILMLPHIKLFYAMCFGVSLFGFALNYFALDSVKNLPEQTSSSFWMEWLAIWDSVVLVSTGIGSGALAFGIDFTTMNRYSCKVFVFQSFAFGTNASTHVVCVAIDRALNLTLPIWHRAQQWKSKVLKLSRALVVFHFILSVPKLFIYEVESGLCVVPKTASTLERFYEVIAAKVFYSLGHFLPLVVANLIFIWFLWRRKKEKFEAKERAKMMVARFRAAPSTASQNNQNSNPRVLSSSSKGPKGGTNLLGSKANDTEATPNGLEKNNDVTTVGRDVASLKTTSVGFEAEGDTVAITINDRKEEASQQRHGQDSSTDVTEPTNTGTTDSTEESNEPGATLANDDSNTQGMKILMKDKESPGNGDESNGQTSEAKEKPTTSTSGNIGAGATWMKCLSGSAGKIDVNSADSELTENDRGERDKKSGAEHNPTDSVSENSDPGIAMMDVCSNSAETAGAELAEADVRTSGRNGEAEQGSTHPISKLSNPGTLLMKDQPGTSGNNDVITTEVELTEKKDAGKETLGTKQVTSAVKNCERCKCQLPLEVAESNSLAASNSKAICSDCYVTVELKSMKADFSLPPEDKRAIVTIMLLSFWYLATSVTAAFVFTLSESYSHASESYAEVKITRVLVIFLLVCSNSFNFLFYLRGNSVRETFRQRWAPEWLPRG